MREFINIVAETKSITEPSRDFMVAVVAQTEPDGFGNRIYNHVVLHLMTIDKDVVFLTALETQDSGHGYGTTVMQWLTQLADEFGVTIQLTPVPHETDHARPMQRDGLVNWYKRFGFKNISHKRMERRPKRARQPVAEGIVTDEEGLALKGWYDVLNRKWVPIPEGWHHTNYVTHHPELFRWDTVFDFPVEDYFLSYENFGQLPPKYEDWIINKMIEGGWVRIGLYVKNMSVYCMGKTLKYAQTGFRYYVKNVLPMDDIKDVVFSTPDSKTLSGLPQMLYNSPVNESVLMEWAPVDEAWFAGSKVVDKQGQPLVCYHGSNADINEFWPLTHFGTNVAAKQRMTDRQDGLVVYPVYLNIKNPLRVTDSEASDEATLLNAIKRGRYPDIDVHFANEHGVIAACEDAGYDGMVYNNRVEHRGRLSWVIFEPDQAKPAI